MKPLTLALLLSLVQATPWPAYIRPDAEIEEHTVTVIHIHDGDTFRSADGRDYRLAGIDAPEVAHPEHGKPNDEQGGPEATEALRALIQGRTVTAFIDRANPTDRYGRTVAIVVTDGIDVNLEMIRSGLAQPRYLDLSPMIDANAFLAQATHFNFEMSDSNLPGEETARTATENEQDHGASSSGITDSQAQSANQTSRRVLAPGDRIRVIIGPQTENFTLNPDGEILVKGLGVFRAGGMTSREASDALDSAVRAMGINVTPITVFYLAPPAKPQRTVMVIGAIRRTGNYPANTLLGAISSADGLTPEANPTEVRVTLGESTTIVNAGRIMIGDAPDLALQGGEVIIVPTYPRIFVSGAVGRPNWVAAQFLSEAISAVGGPLPEADLTRVELRNLTDSPIRIDAQAVFSGKDDDIRLNDRDRITIPLRQRAIAPVVQVYGPVERPGTTEAFTVTDAVREAQPDTTADLQTVMIDRGHGDTTTVNARDIALGHDHDIDLKPGDRILIPRRPEPERDTPQTVTVLGDIARPGPVQPGTLTQVLAKAGGVTNTARTTAIRVRLPDGQAQTYDLAKITQGGQDNPALPANATVYVESDLPRRQSINDLRIFIGIFSTIALLGLRLGG